MPCDEPRYCKKNFVTPRHTIFTYQPRVHTNLEVTTLYAQLKVKAQHVVTAHLERDPGLLYGQKKLNSLMEEEKIYSKRELLY